MRLRSVSRVRSARRLARMVGGCLLLGAVLAGCSGGSYQYRWDFFFDSLFRPDGFILSGMWLTVSIAVTSQIIGVDPRRLRGAREASQTTGHPLVGELLRLDLPRHARCSCRSACSTSA